MIDAKRVITLMVSHHGPQKATMNCVQALLQAGSGLLLIDEGASEVSMARNLILTRLLDELPPTTPREVALLTDDDMSFTLQGALTVADQAWSTGTPVSALYVNAAGDLQVQRVKGTWETGLGLFAIPIPILRAAASRLNRVKLRAYPPGIYPFCQSGIHPSKPDEWTAEDAWLCRTLAPVDLADVTAGHLRPMGLEPSLESVRELIAKMLDKECPLSLEGVL